MLERKVSIQRAREEEKKAPFPSTTATEEGVSITMSERMEDYYDDRSVKAEEEIEDKGLPREISETVSPQDVEAAPAIKWNAVSATKIRTSLGGSVGNITHPIKVATQQHHHHRRCRPMASRSSSAGSSGENSKAIVVEPSLTNGARREVEGRPNRDLGGLTLFLVSIHLEL